MKKYKISAYINGIKHEKIVMARSKEDATDIGWSLFCVDSVYVSEVKE